MSLILDALKRAERDRRAGQMPQALEAVTTAPPEPEPGPGPRRTMIVAVVISLLLAAGLAWALLHRRPQAQPAAAAATPPQAAPTPATRPAEAAAAKATPPAVDDPRIATLDDLVDDKPAAAEPVPATRPAATEVATVPRGKPEPPPDDNADIRSSMTRMTPAPPGADDPEPLPANEQPVGRPAPESPPPRPQQTAASPTPAIASAPVPAPAEAALPTTDYKAMSPNYRAEFPPLSVDVHVYNSEPQRRFVVLNGKRYREGDTIAEGPRIAGIVADGIVFDWRGQRVLYGLPR